MNSKYLVLVMDCYRTFEENYRNDLLYKTGKNNKLDENKLYITDDPMDGLWHITFDKIPIVIIVVEARKLGDNIVPKMLQFYKLIQELFSEKKVLFYCNISHQEILKEAKKIKVTLSRKYYFKNDNFTALRDRVYEEIEYLSQKHIRLNDKWVLRRLGEVEVFKSLGIKSIDKLEGDISERFEKTENDEYSIWFLDEVYDFIFKKRIFPILKYAGFHDIVTNLENFLSFERISYITPFYSENKRYRDHFLHQLRVALFGDFLLTTKIKMGNKYTNLVDIVIEILEKSESAKRFNCKFNERIVRNTWWVTALMHDCSYPLLSIFSPHLFGEESLEKLKKMYIEDLYKQFKENHDKAMESLIEKSEEKLLEMTNQVALMDFYLLIKDAAKTKKSHNIYSAYNFWVKNREKKFENLCFELIVQSILLHHEFCENEDNELDVSFKQYPLAFLLILVDEIQEWGRPFIIKNDKSLDPIAISKIIELEEVSIRGIIKKQINPNKYYYYFDNNGINMKFDYKKTFHNYTNKPTGFEPLIKFTYKKRNLSRLIDQDGTLPPITLELECKGASPEPIQIRRGK